MGTNYYAVKNVCPHCGRGDEPKHIGKSSAGWCFSLHVYPDEQINTLGDWRREFEGATIRDEYGETLSVEEMLKEITERSHRGSFDRQPFGYRDWPEFHRMNESEEGPNGLLRHRRSRYCVGHGEGTWDCLVGEFS